MSEKNSCMDNGHKISKKGFVYILSSPSTDYIKIGGTAYPPAKRIKEINNSEPYKQIGPWSLNDFRGVDDWRAAEHELHYAFRSKFASEIAQQKELFSVSLFEAIETLKNLDIALLSGKPKVDRMFNDIEFRDYLVFLLKTSGLHHWFEMQGIWILSLFPSTSGGRYFTLSIGSHEVAFSTIKKEPDNIMHMVYMDENILNYPKTVSWVKNHSGWITQQLYETAQPHAVAVQFKGNFSAAQEFCI